MLKIFSSCSLDIGVYLHVFSDGMYECEKKLRLIVLIRWFEVAKKKHKKEGNSLPAVFCLSFFIDFWVTMLAFFFQSIQLNFPLSSKAINSIYWPALEWKNEKLDWILIRISSDFYGDPEMPLIFFSFCVRTPSQFCTNWSYVP